jgi:hypothetical protein
MTLHPPQSPLIGLVTLMLVLSSACGNPVENASLPEISLSVVSGSGQTGAVGAELPQPLVVRVTKVVRGVTIGVPLQLVNFRVVRGGGSVFAGSAMTDLQGVAREYWTLGPEAGANALEVRAVDPATGQKQVYGTFEATGVIPRPEVCNGVDDNLDGTVDDPTWSYCSGGAAAPNTDGKNSCSAGYLDLNGTATDGCERLVGGTWGITPALTMSCPGLLINEDFRVETFTLDAPSRTQLSITAGVLSAFVDFDLRFDVPFVPSTESFGGSGALVPVNSSGISLTGTFALDGRFTSPTTFEATLDLSIDLTANVPGIGLRDGNCEDLHQTVTGSRAGA